MSGYNAGVISAFPGVVESLGGMARLLPPGHALLATRAVTSDDGDFTEYLVEGPWLPGATLGRRPSDVRLKFKQALSPDGRPLVTGWFEHAPSHAWQLTF